MGDKTITHRVQVSSDYKYAAERPWWPFLNDERIPKALSYSMAVKLYVLLFSVTEDNSDERAWSIVGKHSLKFTQYDK